MVVTRWPEDQVVLLRRLAAQELSASQIATQLDVTKNQVVGICRRRGIRLLGNNHGGGWHDGTERKATRPLPVARKERPVIVPVPVVLVAPPTPPARRARACQWIDGSAPMWRTCGEPVWRGSWCEAHHRRVYPRHRESVA